jgi:hypothetical protein
LKFKINNLLYEENEWTVTLGQTKTGKTKDHGHTYMFYLNIFLNGGFEYGDGGIVKLMRSMQTLQQSKKGHRTAYADSPSEDQHLCRITFMKNQNTIMAGS